MKSYLFIVVLLLFFTQTEAQMFVDLYGGTAPNTLPCDKKETYAKNGDGIGIVSGVTKPTLQMFVPAVPNAGGASVIICPGGGYSVLAVDHEGYDVARQLNAMGVTAFVLKYRLPDAGCMTSRENVPLMDAQQALKVVREHAAKWKIDALKIGIMGFSAGGHLASTLGTHFAEAMTANPNNTSLRPDFMVLIYPVISFNDSTGHRGSRDNLLGRTPAAEMVAKFSNELQVTTETPPAFLVHAADDGAVPAVNSTRFAEALVKYKVPVELHLYPKGGHGFGMNNKTTKDEWMERLKNWMLASGFLQ